MSFGESHGHGGRLIIYMYTFRMVLSVSYGLEF